MAEDPNDNLPLPDESPENIREKSPEEEWAERLQINFTPPKLTPTPPPLPESERRNDPNNDPSNGHSDENNDNLREANSSAGRFHSPQFAEPMPSTFLIWSILSTVFCCFIPGIVAIIFSSQVSTRYYSGDIEGARRASRNAEIWIIASFVLGVLSATLYVPFLMIN